MRKVRKNAPDVEAMVTLERPPPIAAVVGLANGAETILRLHTSTEQPALQKHSAPDVRRIPSVDRKRPPPPRDHAQRALHHPLKLCQGEPRFQGSERKPAGEEISVSGHETAVVRDLTHQRMAH